MKLIFFFKASHYSICIQYITYLLNVGEENIVWKINRRIEESLKVSYYTPTGKHNKFHFKGSSYNLGIIN